DGPRHARGRRRDGAICSPAELAFGSLSPTPNGSVVLRPAPMFGAQPQLNGLGSPNCGSSQGRVRAKLTFYTVPPTPGPSFRVVRAEKGAPCPNRRGSEHVVTRTIE